MGASLRYLRLEPTLCLSLHNILAKLAMQYRIVVATEPERELIYAHRHDIYARELGQHAVNSEGKLSDALDEHNEYLVLYRDDDMAGFVSLTNTNSVTYSVDKYFDRSKLPFAIGNTTQEVRLLTVLPRYRHTAASLHLMNAALQRIEAAGAEHVVAIGRQEVIGLYERCGLERKGLIARSGKVTFELLRADVADLRARAAAFKALLDRNVLAGAAHCYHGGEFYTAIGEKFDHLDRRHGVIKSDTLDAWYPPSPKVRAILHDHIDWILSTSPPTHAKGLEAAIAEHRGIPAHCVIAGAGSSDLMFLAMRELVKPEDRVVILDPMYGEYLHVLKHLCNSTPNRVKLNSDKHFAVDLQVLADHAGNADHVFLVNPNSPTGQHIRAADLATLMLTHGHTHFWIDETYIDHIAGCESLERLAAIVSNLTICKSMSKYYALSGARVGYLVSSTARIERLRPLSPPWSVSHVAQIAATYALQDHEYYQERVKDTQRSRDELAAQVESLGWKVYPGVANFILCEMPIEQGTAAELIHRCKQRNLFIRDVGSMGYFPNDRFLRLTVLSQADNKKMLTILKEELGQR